MSSFLKNIIRFALFILVQVFILNEVPPLHHFVTPYIYFLFVLWLPFKMGRRTVMILALALSTGGLVIQSAAMAQDHRGTWEQQMACTPDVWRLCASQIPDVNHIVSCLKDNTPQLSEPCRAVFTSSDNTQAPAQAVRRSDRTARIAR